MEQKIFVRQPMLECSLADRHGKFPHAGKLAVDLRHMLENAEMKLEVNARRRVQRNIVIIPLVLRLIAKLLAKKSDTRVKGFFVDEHVDITARPKPRSGIERTKHRALEGQKANACFLKNTSYFRKLIIHALLTKHRDHLLFFEFFRDLALFRK